MKVKVESVDDVGAVADVIRQAFGREDEARLVAELRRDPAFVPELSFVAEDGSRVVGHLLFTRAPIAGELGTWPALALAPLSVLPGWQRQGVGSALVRHGLDECRRLGHRLVVVLGHAEYYPRFGFRPAHAAGIEAPFPVRPESFFALELTPNALPQGRGVIHYARPFLG